jgi:hypothetical protein
LLAQQWRDDWIVVAGTCVDNEMIDCLLHCRNLPWRLRAAVHVCVGFRLQCSAYATG